MEKENFINEILNSANGITKVAPNDDLFFKIQNRIEPNTISSKTIWLVAASIIVLCTINVGIIINSKAIIREKSEVNLANELHKSNQLY